MSLIDDTGSPTRLLKYLADSIPLGPHPEPHNEFVFVRLDVVQTAIDHIEWLEKGNEEWRKMYVKELQRSKRLSAVSRIAIKHLDMVLNSCLTASDQQNADTDAREWLASLGEVE